MAKKEVSVGDFESAHPSKVAEMLKGADHNFVESVKSQLAYRADTVKKSMSDPRVDITSARKQHEQIKAVQREVGKHGVAQANRTAIETYGPKLQRHMDYFKQSAGHAAEVLGNLARASSNGAASPTSHREAAEAHHLAGHAMSNVGRHSEGDYHRSAARFHEQRAAIATPPTSGPSHASAGAHEGGGLHHGHSPAMQEAATHSTTALAHSRTASASGRHEDHATAAKSHETAARTHASLGNHKEAAAHMKLAADHMKTARTIVTGPRGGKYEVSKTGKKHSLSKKRR